jgi:DNA-binding NarL/FixJ family response regulator
MMLTSRFADVTTVEAGSMLALRKMISGGALDLVIIGLSEEQPGINRTALKKTMQKNPLASFIVYAIRPEAALARSLTRMGVKGILAKNGLPEELVSCVQSVIAGHRYVCSSPDPASLTK